MNKKFFILLLLLQNLLIAYVDSDFDGVEDGIDRCPNTTFLELVDISGCTTVALSSPSRIDFIIGGSYSDSTNQTITRTDTLSSSLQVDYYYKDFSLQASTSYYTTSGGYTDNGLYDSFLGMAYQYYLFPALSVRIGAGIIIPTYTTALDNNNMDYTASLNLSYAFKKFSFFGGYSYTIIKDDDVTIIYNQNQVQDINYQNIDSISFGVGYYINNNFYINTALNHTKSVYTTSKDIQTLSLYAYYAIDNHWFTTLSYARGLSDTASQNYFSWRVGYFF